MMLGINRLESGQGAPVVYGSFGYSVPSSLLLWHLVQATRLDLHALEFRCVGDEKCPDVKAEKV